MQESLKHTPETSVPQIAVVRVDLHLNKEFHYLIPKGLSDQVLAGTRVRVPFGSRKILGTVIKVDSPAINSSSSSLFPGMETFSTSNLKELKPILEIMGAPALIPPPLLKLAEWISSYYLCPMDQVLKSLTPSVVQKRVSMRRVKTKVDAELESLSPELVPTQPLALTPKQAEALEQVLSSLKAPQPKPILLFGVTGSGKTEVYLQAIDHILKEGKGAIFLVPEIALTPQTVDRLRARFSSFMQKDSSSSILAVLHSGLSQGERLREWKRVRSGEARVVIGPRSAIFAPVEKLGLIVVDEEHENTYKQEENPRYHARDVAVMRGHFEGAGVVLGSATPSLESFYNSQCGKYTLCRMPERTDAHKLPIIRIIDMRKEIFRPGSSIFSEPLKSAILLRLERGEQVILYLNHRGYATSMICKKCGHVEQCPQCSVTMTYHLKDQKLKCHFCGFTKGAPKVCPVESCRDPSIRYSGIGTEKLEQTVTKLFPQARVARMDSDTMTHRNDYEKTLLRFKMGKLDILLGTQMIAKGLDFPRVTLVGIVHADIGLHLPDFRSGERTFQQITQVAGRAGRGDVEGEVLVQTFTPQHYAIQHAKKQDFESFSHEEFKFRESLNYPPFDRLTKIECSSAQSTKASYVAEQIQKQLHQRLGDSLRILGPAPAPIPKLHGKFRYQIFLKDGRVKHQKEVLREVLAALPRQAEVKVTADVDPLHML